MYVCKKKHKYLPLHDWDATVKSVGRVQLEKHAHLRLLLESGFCSASPPIDSMPRKILLVRICLGYKWASELVWSPWRMNESLQLMEVKQTNLDQPKCSLGSVRTD